MITSNLLFCVKHEYEKDNYGAEHAHPCYELVYYCSGEGKVSFNKRKYKFSTDTFMICGPDVKHVEFDKAGTEVLYIGFELFGDAEIPQGLFNESDYHIKEYLDKIYDETKHGSTYSFDLINLFCTIITIKMKNKQEEKELFYGHNFENVVGYISAYYGENIKVAQLAKMAGYSYDHFRKLFYKKFNMTINDFILQKRIEAATEMLKSSDFLIKEIAMNCGFKSVAQFCTKYRQVMGVSPKQKQLKLKNSENDIEKDKFS